MTQEIWPGHHQRRGAAYDGNGTNIAVWAPDASDVWVCLFDDAGAETRLRLPEHTLGVWHGYLPGVGPGQRYGLRVDGPWRPDDGLPFNPDKLLLDPYALAIDGAVTPDPSLPTQTPDGERNPGDSAGAVPRSVVVAPGDFDWGDDRRPDTPWSNTVVYEAHVRGLTIGAPQVPEPIRGTYAGLGHAWTVSYLRDLGVTAVELLPVHHFVPELELLERGLTNYWGYNSVGWLAPHAAYSSAGSRGEQVREFKEMVRALHAGGLEVILDVVYNHTTEGDPMGPALCLRGLDDAGAYLRDGHGGYLDATGCGNTVAVSASPQTLRLVMDSLRYWVQEMHVDGFRFDLAPALCRPDGSSAPDLRAAFLTAVAQDPVLRDVKLIAEPWDATGDGYLVGRFPPPWCEWNDKFRDTVRDFWRGQSGGVRDLASRLSGSSDLYADDGRLPFSSINLVTAHDGFTLRDLVSYDEKHNAANGFDNTDGTSDNRSWNCGVEGETDDAEVRTLRRRQAANLLATLLLATGVPMVVAGDERGRTQGGNNNAFCQDNETSWVDWSDDGQWSHLGDLARFLLRLRAEHPVLRQRFFFDGVPVHPGGRKDISWLHPRGTEMTGDDWADSSATTLGVLLAGDAMRAHDERGRRLHDTSYLLWLHAGADACDVTLPDGYDGYRVLLRTDEADPVRSDEGEREAGTGLKVSGRTLVLLEALRR